MLLTFAAIRFLKKYLRKDMRVYEYGVGASTLFFCGLVREVASIDSDPSWVTRVRSELEKRGYGNANISLCSPTEDSSALVDAVSDPDAYVSSDPACRGKSFRAYAESIDTYPDGFFDVVLIDGRARPSCFKHARSKVVVGGCLILDNAERADYGYIHDQLRSHEWLAHHFYGPGPFNSFFWQTSIWRRM